MRGYLSPRCSREIPGAAGFRPPHNKDLQTPEACENSGPQPAWAPLWLEAQEAGDSRFFVSRGYAHVNGIARGFGKSEGDVPVGLYGNPTDLYDLIEWIAAQPWCDGNLGMIGISAFAGAQWQAAIQQPNRKPSRNFCDPSFRLRAGWTQAAASRIRRQ